MPRLFVGLTIPDHIKQYLLFVQGGVTHARWQSADQMHITLRFIGDVDGAEARDIESALGSIYFAPFSVYCEGVGLFGKTEKARALWAAAKPKSALTSLHHKVDQVLAYGARMPRERRQYEPHVTLARFTGRHGALGGFLENSSGLKTLEWQVDHVTLFLSTLGAQGAHYTPIGTFGADQPGYEADYGDGAETPHAYGPAQSYMGAY